MNTQKRYPREVRERAVRMVLEHKGEYDSQGAAIGSVATKLGMTAEMLRKWVRQAETDGGLRSGVTTEERARVKELERENRELRRANEILKAAAAFSGRTSTALRRDDRLHPGAQGRVRGRADLRDAADRPFHLLCREGPPPVSQATPRRGAHTRDHPRLRGESIRLRPPARYGGNSGDRGSRWPVARSSASCALWRTPTPA